MVTRTVIRISPEEAKAKAKALTPAPAAKASSSSSAAAPVDSLNNDNLTKNQAIQKPKTSLCNHPSCTKRAQLPSPLCWMHGAQDVTCKFTGCNKKGILHGLCPGHGGLVQLCRSRGCINEVNLEKRGGLCWMHRVKGQHDDDDDDSSSEEGEEIRLCRFRGCISRTSTDEGLCDRHSTHEKDYFVNKGEQKRALSSVDSTGDNDTTKKRRKVNNFAIDLTDVPPQSPIPKSAGHIKEGASKYTGVSFDKQTNKWVTQMMIEGKIRRIGYYYNEEEAAVDYARALFKYKGQGALGKAGEQKAKSRIQSSPAIDLSDVPPQPPILKSAGHIKDGASKYTGVSFNKAKQRWNAQIMMDGKQHCIGYYDNEEDAAVDYARAVFKYRGQGVLDKARERNVLVKASVHSSLPIDLSDVPSQPPIPKSAGHIKEGASKYTGVSFHKWNHKWNAQIMMDGKQHCIGFYDNEEEAAVDYARAVFKYKGQGALDKAEEQKALSKVGEHSLFTIDLSDVPPQPPIPKSAGRIKEGTSKYTGVSFHKQIKKWYAKITIEGKQRCIGFYTNEEEAAVDYARAVIKYKGDNTRKQPIEPVENRPMKRQRQNSFDIDLTDVPMQTPIPKSAGYIKQGASKYTGVCFNKQANKWCAQLKIEGKVRRIGSYENEDEAAVDYARALHKYRRDLKRHPKQNSFIVDLNDVPPQPLILKNDLSQSKEYNDNTRRRNVREGSSKHTGVYFAKDVNKWKAQIMIEGIVRSIGYYEIEEDAAADYARAVFKYKPKKGYATYGGLDLKGIPDQPLIRSETSKSGYMGVKRNKSRWEATLNGKNLGTFDTKEQAAGIYARARYYVDKGGKPPAKKKKRAIAAVPEESIDLVAV
eukprot:scaffold16542_cov152-Skeletonema_dohrnii-CCMP3373.AAC.6